MRSVRARRTSSGSGAPRRRLRLGRTRLCAVARWSGASASDHRGRCSDEGAHHHQPAHGFVMRAPAAAIKRGERAADCRHVRRLLRPRRPPAPFGDAPLRTPPPSSPGATRHQRAGRTRKLRTGSSAPPPTRTQVLDAEGPARDVIEDECDEGEHRYPRPRSHRRIHEGAGPPRHGSGTRGVAGNHRSQPAGGPARRLLARGLVAGKAARGLAGEPMLPRSRPGLAAGRRSPPP